MTDTPNTPDAAGLNWIRETLELFRKQCINKGGGIGFEEAVNRIEHVVIYNYRSVADIVATLDKMYTTKKPFRMPQNGCHQHMTYVDGCRDCKLRYPYYVPEPVDDNPYNPILNKIIDDLRQALNLPSAGTGGKQ